MLALTCSVASYHDYLFYLLLFGASIYISFDCLFVSGLSGDFVLLFICSFIHSFFINFKIYLHVILYVHFIYWLILAAYFPFMSFHYLIIPFTGFIFIFSISFRSY